MPHPFFDLPTPLVIGHRGAAGEAPENTLASFARGLAEGAVILESDVHLTRDGVPVLIHDDDVARVSDGTGRVAEFDLADLQRLDAGYRFSRDGGRTHPERGRGHCIPTLQEVFDALPFARLNLELKEDLPGLVEHTVAVVCDAGRLDHTLLTSGDDAVMHRLRTHVASLGLEPALGASQGDVAGFVRSMVTGDPPPPGPMALQIPPYFAGQPLVTPALVEHAHRHGVQVHVWTINEPDEMTRLLDLGVDGLVTDHPARMTDVLSSRH